jgi:hypothetical protein
LVDRIDLRANTAAIWDDTSLTGNAYSASAL